ncbi:MAG TPA: DUF2306 domain-containing protein [Bryobacteraceae bacterium]|jgi:hypothetical protein|nr:DUF2306 domain-containing protein [Bryobacteraceae bacterium]
MASSALLTRSSSRFRFQTVLWVSLGLTTLFVFVTSEALLVVDYPMYHAYRLQVIADRRLLIPHVLSSLIPLLAGPPQFSSRLRQLHPKLHRVLGYLYVSSVPVGALTGIALSAGRPGMPGTIVQAAAWIVCTAAAFVTARNRQFVQHRRWMARSYAVTFTFVSTRVLNPWPRYWSHLGDSFAALGLIVFTLASLLIVDLGLNWRELDSRHRLNSFLTGFRGMRNAGREQNQRALNGD